MSCLPILNIAFDNPYSDSQIKTKWGYDDDDDDDYYSP